MDTSTRVDADADAQFNNLRTRTTVVIMGLFPLLVGTAGVVNNQLVQQRPIDTGFWLGLGFIVLGIALISWNPNKHRRKPRVHAHIEVSRDTIVWGKRHHIFRTWRKMDGDVVWVRRANSALLPGRELQVGEDRRPMPRPDFEQFNIEQLRSAVLAHGWAWRFDDSPAIRQD